MPNNQQNQDNKYQSMKYNQNFDINNGFANNNAGNKINYNPQERNNNNPSYDMSNSNVSSRLEFPKREIPEFQNNIKNFMSDNRQNINMDVDHDERSQSSRDIPSNNNYDKIKIDYKNINDSKDIYDKLNFNSNNVNPNLINFNPNNNNLINNSIKIENSDIDADLRFSHKNNFFGGSKNYDFIEPETDTCMCCGTIEDLLPLECCHMICNRCFLGLAEKDVNSITCKKSNCNEKVQYQYLQMILGEEKLTQLEKMSVDKIVNEFGQRHNCPGCGELIIFEVGKVDYKIKDEKNQIISNQAAECYAQNRCKCPRCQKEFCINCNFSPFHLGKTCEEQRRFKEAKKCKYCNSEIKSNNQGPSNNVCKAEECVVAFNTACPKKLLCGHQCYGTKFDKTCPPCLNKSCESYVNLYDQQEDDYCNICFAEGLGSAPIILFKCNHYVHYKCADLCLKKKYIGPKITFNHMKCPTCKNQMDCPNTAPIQLQINENKQLYDLIVKMSLERLKFEGLEKDPLLIEKSSAYYNKPIDFALKKLSYYMCYECKKPYFAGLRDCRGGPDDDNNPNREYNQKDLVCGAHANIAGVAGITDCPKHGKDFIEYKCRFCCNISSWFCWGTTHFCEDCHAKQCKGDYVSKYAKDKLPKCPGTDKCPIKTRHPDNGDEYALGCSVCRNASDNHKNF